MKLFQAKKLLAVAVLSQAFTSVYGFAPVTSLFRETLGSGGAMQRMASRSDFEYALLFDCDGVILETEGEKRVVE
jgi:hypothetical protein